MESDSIENNPFCIEESQQIELDESSEDSSPDDSPGDSLPEEREHAVVTGKYNDTVGNKQC